MQAFAAHIARMDDCEAILEYVYANCKDEGASWFSYHFTPAFESQTSKKAFIWARDYPLEYQKLYIGADYKRRDPVPQLTFEHGPILTWTGARKLAQGDRGAEAYFERLDELGVDNWVAFALFGPRNRDAFALVRFGQDPDHFAMGRLQQVQSLLLAAHLQICKVIDEGKPSVVLSEREREVLEWMGRGKSSNDIATILEISPETVRTYTRRIYDKLQTNDRVTATVRALKLGLVEL